MGHIISSYGAIMLFSAFYEEHSGSSTVRTIHSTQGLSDQRCFKNIQWNIKLQRFAWFTIWRDQGKWGQNTTLYVSNNYYLLLSANCLATPGIAYSETNAVEACRYILREKLPVLYFNVTKFHENGELGHNRRNTNAVESWNSAMIK